MKYIISIAATALALTLSTASCHRQPVQSTVDDTDELADDHEVDELFFDWEHYYGDTLYQYGNKTVCLTHGYGEITDGVSSNDGTILITLTDSIPTDTCIVSRYSKIKADGDKLCLTVGGDTLRVDFRKLPKKIDAVNSLMVKGFDKYTYRYVFALSDSSFNCEFDFTAYLPKPVPVWTKQIMSVLMNTNIRSMYSKRMDCTLDEYNGIARPNRESERLDVADMKPQEIARYYSRLDSRLYAKEYRNNDANPPGMGPKYDYLFSMTPAWLSSDSTLITYRFQTFSYIMGAHGMTEEYYITFESATGKILSWNDILSEADYKAALAVVERQLTDYKRRFMEDENIESYPAGLEKEDLYTDISTLTKEKYNGKYYPRPALTKNGLIFSYQPYEAGSFSEGIFHFIVPYSALQSMKLK